eukprot:8335395-Alexandrium_andersonii.AAC.1
MALLWRWWCAGRGCRLLGSRLSRLRIRRLQGLRCLRRGRVLRLRRRGLRLSWMLRTARCLRLGHWGRRRCCRGLRRGRLRHRCWSLAR